MVGGLGVGDELEVTYKELPFGTLLTLAPNPTTSPFLIPSLDDTKCYQVNIKKKCAGGVFGDPVSGQYGTCGVTPPPCNPPSNISVTEVNPPCIQYFISGGIGVGELGFTYTDCNGQVQVMSDFLESVTICGIFNTVVLLSGNLYLNTVTPNGCV